jgi:osmotically inducible lipoprotein OsmB
MNRIILAATLSVSLFALGACGHTTSDRVLSGGGIGAGVGLVGGALVGAPVAGAAIGAVAGGAAGGLTDSHQINLGKPIWR